MSLPAWALPFKEPRTEIKYINNKYCKYEVSYQYDISRKRSKKKTGRLLGRITETGGFIPSSKNALRQENEQAPKADIKSFGVYAIFETMLKEEIPILVEVFGKERAEELLTFAMMRRAHRSPIKRIGTYQSHGFCSEYWSPNKILSDKQTSAVLKSTGENRELVIECMKKLPGNEKAKNENFILMDSAHIMSSPEHLSINAKGYNPSFDFGKQIRLMRMFSAQFKKLGFPFNQRKHNGYNLNAAVCKRNGYTGCCFHCGQRILRRGKYKVIRRSGIKLFNSA